MPKSERYVVLLTKYSKQLASKRKNTPNIIFIYDFHKVEFDFKEILNKLLNSMKNEIKFNIQIIYCFPNYSYFSFDKLNTDLKDMKKENQALKEENQKAIQSLKEENQKIMNELKKLKK